MKTELWVIGKTKQNFVREGIQFYQKRVKPFAPITLVELKESAGKSADMQKSSESKTVLSKISIDDHLVILDEGGKGWNSIEFSHYIEIIRMNAHKRLIFLIGGAYGFHESIYERANQKMSLSKMTFPHDLARLIFLEQYYRAYTILNNRNYHHI